MKELAERARAEVAKVVVGQEGTLSGLVAALLVRGHVLLEGVPGVAKTLLVKAVSAALSLATVEESKGLPKLAPRDMLMTSRRSEKSPS